MCDLPESEAELEQYVVDQVAFQNLFCHGGLLTFGFHVADVFVRRWRNAEK